MPIGLFFNAFIYKSAGSIYFKFLIMKYRLYLYQQKGTLPYLPFLLRIAGGCPFWSASFYFAYLNPFFYNFTGLPVLADCLAASKISTTI